MNWVSINSGNSLSPVRCQAITWTNADSLSFEHLGTNFSEIWIEIISFPFKKIHLKLSSAKMVAILSRGGDELSTPIESLLRVNQAPVPLKINAMTFSKSHDIKAMTLVSRPIKQISWHSASHVLTLISWLRCAHILLKVNFWWRWRKIITIHA